MGHFDWVEHGGALQGGPGRACERKILFFPGECALFPFLVECNSLFGPAQKSLKKAQHGGKKIVRELDGRWDLDKTKKKKENKGDASFEGVGGGGGGLIFEWAPNVLGRVAGGVLFFFRGGGALRRGVVWVVVPT